MSAPTRLPAQPTARAAAVAERDLAAAAPDLVEPFRRHLRRATEIVARRLVSAVHREGLTGDARTMTWSGGRLMLPCLDGGYLPIRARRHAFDRIEVTDDIALDPAGLLRRLAGRTPATRAVAVELTDASVNLSLALARRARLNADAVAATAQARDSLDLVAGLDAEETCLFFERLATEGHNLHPCGRTRLGWSVADVLAHDLETPGTGVRLLAVRRDLHVGDDVGDYLGAALGVAGGAVGGGRGLDGYVITPVHAWQFDRVIATRYADLLAERALVALPVELPARPTAALRTLLLPAGPDGERRYVKVSLDIQVTSTRRTISVASTRNGPVLSALLATMLAEGGCGERTLLMAEPAGSAVIASAQRQRDIAAVVREGLAGRLAPGEIPVPGLALCAVSPVTGQSIVAEIVARFARTRAIPGLADAALAFVNEYARLLLCPVLALAARHGIALEAHLQNCVPTFVDGVPHRLALRDLAGLRVYPPRARRDLHLWPGSVVVTDDVDVMRAKLAYTAFQANLGEVIVRLASAHDLDERAAWRRVRGIIDEVYDELGTAEARADHAFLTRPSMPHKALLRMRLAQAVDAGVAQDIYARVENPLR